MHTVTEASYPITFRAETAKELGQHLSAHHSVVMVGMKRVGISNFLRFFLNHNQVQTTYIAQHTPRLFIPIDLNDLVSCQLFPFWTLTLKRIVDMVETTQLPDAIKRQCQHLFSQSIQLNDLFVTFDSVQKVIDLLAQHHVNPVLFFIRFDRLKDSITSEFFHNLESLIDHAQRKLSLVFTSYRPLPELMTECPSDFAEAVFLHHLYLPPAQDDDQKILLKTLMKQLPKPLPATTQKLLSEFSGGHVQYLQLALICVGKMKKIPDDAARLLLDLSHDEAIALQSEEIFASLKTPEQTVLLALAREEKIARDAIPAYLQKTGIVTVDAHHEFHIFSPLFKAFLQQHSIKSVTQLDFTKKEHLLFTFLQARENRLCEREEIVEAIWPECAETGVSDWAIDRLVSRVRTKLKEQKSRYQIVTIVTRGYKLTQAE